MIWMWLAVGVWAIVTAVGIVYGMRTGRCDVPASGDRQLEADER
jgi:hypothetical protein